VGKGYKKRVRARKRGGEKTHLHTVMSINKSVVVGIEVGRAVI